MAVVVPRPKPKVNTAIAVKPGAARNVRTA
jgi:hypothetical protein